jgi:hypothetical protein
MTKIQIPWYPSMLQEANLSNWAPKVQRPVGSYITAYPPLYKAIEEAKDALVAFFKSSSPPHPYVGLVLGPPGAGKSRLVREMTVAVGKALGLKRKVTPPEALNLSQIPEPQQLLRDLAALAKKAASAKKADDPCILFLDEFDVTIGSSSAARFLISPLYDGCVWSDGEKISFPKNTAFILSGGYLADVDILRQLEASAQEVNFPLLSADLAVREYAVEIVGEMASLARARDEVASTEAGSMVYRLNYLNKLEKVIDLLSRINGFLIELPDLSDPSEVTPWAPLRFCFCSRPTDTYEHVGRKDLRRILSLWQTRCELEDHPVSSSDHFVRPLEIYKHALVSERLLRVVAFLRARLDKQYGASPGKVSSPLLHFLSLVPVRYGMRSIETLVSCLKAPHRQRGDDGSVCFELCFEKLDDKQVEVLRRHILCPMDAGNMATIVNRFWEDTAAENLDCWPSKKQYLPIPP